MSLCRPRIRLVSDTVHTHSLFKWKSAAAPTQYRSHPSANAPQDFDWNELQKIPVAHGKTEHDVLDHETRLELDAIHKICVKAGVALSFVLLVLWPVLTLPAQVFGIVSAVDDRTSCMR